MISISNEDNTVIVNSISIWYSWTPYKTEIKRVTSIHILQVK